MKKLFLLMVLVLLLSIPADAGEETELTRIRCTCYLPTGNPTYSGVYPYEGIVAANKEHLGQVAMIYNESLEFIGCFECKDIGGHRGLKNGTRIDIFRDNSKSAKEWTRNYGDYVYIKWIDGKG